MERGWFLGDQALKKELLAQMHEQRGDHYGSELREADEVHAERVLRDVASRRVAGDHAVLSAARAPLQNGPLYQCLPASSFFSNFSTLGWITKRQ